MQIPTDYQAFLALSPEGIQRLCDDLAERPVNAGNMDQWLQDWAAMAALFQEPMARFDVATAVNTADDEARQRLKDYRETIWPIGMRMFHRMNERLQANEDLIPPPLRAVKARQKAMEQLNQSQEAMALLNREAELVAQFQDVFGKQSVEWQGEAVNLRQLNPVLHQSDRALREEAWRLIHNRRKQDHDAISRLWPDLLDTRLALADINGFDNYLEYRWVQLGRVDYTPDDSQTLHQSLLKHWSPLHEHLVEQQRALLQLDSVRPWDIDAPLHQAPQWPFANTDDLLDRTITVFRRMDGDFGAYVENLREMKFIDLAERRHTAAVGGFSRAIGRHGNFIFLNIERTHQDVLNIVHELGHAISIHASCRQPYQAFWGFPADFSETPSTVMEMMTQRYWDEFYEPADLETVRADYWRSVVRHSLQECVFDAFQHWVYRNPATARDVDACQAHWHDLMRRHLPGMDWSGLESLNAVSWSVTLYLPLHALEYVYGRMAGMQLMALSEDEALARYKAAIALGNSATTKALFAELGMAFPVTEDAVVAVANNLARRLGFA